MNLDTILGWIALPDQLVSILKLELFGNNVFQYGLFACVILAGFVLSRIASLTFRKIFVRAAKKLGDEMVQRIVENLRRPIRMMTFCLLVGLGDMILTAQPTEADPKAHWVHWGIDHLLSVGFRLSLFWILARVLEVVWKDVLQPLIDKKIEGDEKRYFPVIYRLIMTIVWVMAVVYCIPVFGYDAVELVGMILGFEAMHNTIGQYMAFIGIALLTMLMARTLYSQINNLILEIAKRGKIKNEDVWLEGFEKPLLYLIILVGFRIAAGALTDQVEGQGAAVYGIISAVANVLLTADITWMFLILTDKIYDNFIIPLLSAKGSFDQQIVPLTKKAVKVAIGVVGFIFVIKALGKEPETVLAGLGIGGVAIGFAAKDTLSPFISGIAIYLTRPYNLGDYIVVDKDFEGTVEDIGLRATMLRTKQGTSFIIPNDKIINTPIHNMMNGSKECPAAFDGLFLRVDIAEAPDARDLAMRIFEEAVEKTEGVGKPRVFFLEYGNDNMGLFLTYWVEDPKRFFDIRHDIMLKIDDRLREANIHMSTPTAALTFRGYLGGDWPTMNLGLPEPVLQALAASAAVPASKPGTPSV